ncbi:MAG TPA: hypothetical protein VFG69_11445, partial [Nannocystaceae bacterium]|nr:hypothetical protein [Nannocystaceae bacterium]
IHYLHQHELWLRSFRHGLQFAFEWLVHGRPDAKAFGRAVVDAIDRRFGPDHLAFDHARQTALVRDWLTELLDLGSAAADSIERLAAAFVRDGDAPVALRPTTREIDMRFDGTAPRRLLAFTGPGFPEPSLADLDIARGWVAAIGAVDGATTVDGYAAAVERGLAAVSDCGQAARTGADRRARS